MADGQTDVRGRPKSVKQMVIKHKAHAPGWLKGAATAVIAAHVALIMLAIAKYANMIPVADEWHAAMNSAVAIKVMQGTLTLNDIFANYNGHRLPLTLALTALNTALFRYDPRLEMLVTAALLIGNFSLLALILRQQLGQNAPRLFWSGLIALACMVFTGRWITGWTWAFLNLWQFGIFFTLLGILAADRMKSSGRLALVLTLLCSAAAFSNSSGILAFGVVGLVWWLRGERRWTHWALFAAAAAACFAVVFILPDERYGYNRIMLAPLDNLYFTALHLGAVQITPALLRYGVLETSSKDFALLAFAAGLLFSVLNVRFLLQRVRPAALAAIFAITLWGISFALATSIGRFEVYIENVLHLDYHTPMVMMFWLGAVMLSLLALQKMRKGALRTTNILFVCFVVGAQLIFTALASLYVLLPLFHLDEIVTGPRECPLTVLIGNKNCDFFELFPNEMVHGNALGLAQFRLAVFRDVEQQPVPLALHFLPVLHAAPDFEAPFDSRAIVLNGTAQYVLYQRTARLAQALELPELPDYRFTLRGALSLAPTCAEQRIQARLIVDDGQAQRVAIDQMASVELTPFALDLSDLRGRAFTLLYEVQDAPLSCGHILWANPRIEFSLAKASMR
jgi:hypothetical protein